MYDKSKYFFSCMDNYNFFKHDPVEFFQCVSISKKINLMTILCNIHLLFLDTDIRASFLGVLTARYGMPYPVAYFNKYDFVIF